MSVGSNRFSSLKEAVRDKAAAREEALLSGHPERSAATSHHAPTAAFGGMETLPERIMRLERELQEQGSQRDELAREVERLKGLERGGPVASDQRLVFVSPDQVVDLLPRDRSEAAFSDAEFDALQADIEAHGQNDAITVRRGGVDGAAFEIAAGRRRLRVCANLGRDVLARVRDLDDAGMLRVQYAENERRADVASVDRARWFVAVRKASSEKTDLAFASRFGMDATTFSVHQRIARFPDEVLSRLADPTKLSMRRARDVMEDYELDRAGTVARMLAALDAFAAAARDKDAGRIDPVAQVEVVVRAASAKAVGKGYQPRATPQQLTHGGRRIGSLARNGRHWVLRFATSITDEEVQSLVDRLRDSVAPEPTKRGKAR